MMYIVVINPVIREHQKPDHQLYPYFIQNTFFLYLIFRPQYHVKFDSHTLGIGARLSDRF
jgi:hypothetical protein